MKPAFLIFVSFLFQFSDLKAQPELEPGDVLGVIITKNDVIEGILRLNGGPDNLWGLQTKVFFISTEDAKGLTELRDEDFTKYNPKDIEGYQFGANRYLTTKYTPMSELGMKLGNKKFFIRNLVEGRISLYLFYENPFHLELGEDGGFYKDTENSFRILLQKGRKPLRDILLVKILKFIEDCPEVKEKYLTGGYDLRPMDKEKKGLKKIFSNVISHEKLKKSAVEMFTEYNNECGGE